MYPDSSSTPYTVSPPPEQYNTVHAVHYCTIQYMQCTTAVNKALQRGGHTFFSSSTKFYSSSFVFTLIFQKNVSKLVLFMLYQGVWGLQHTVKSALQPLVFIHVIDIRCYETIVADYYAYCSNQLSGL